MRRVISIVFSLILGIATTSAQTARQIKAGELARIQEGLTLKVVTGDKATFSSVKLKGAPYVIVLQLESPNREVSLSYKLSGDLRQSDIFLTTGSQKITARAVMEDFPSWGSDNDKEIESVDPNDTGAVSLNFRRSGSVSILFDLPADQLTAPKKLTVGLKTLKPTEQQHSFVVTL